MRGRLFSAFETPLDGKQLMLSIAETFAAEFDQAAKDYLTSQGIQREIHPLKVTTAYPTTQYHCPSIVVRRTGSQPQFSGMGGHIGIQDIEGGLQSIEGETVTDSIEISICTLNEIQRDEIHLWLQQYILDAAIYMGSYLAETQGMYRVQVRNAADDQVEYQGGQEQPGFQFYVGTISVSVIYDRLILTNVDRIKTLLNWQLFFPELLWAGKGGDKDPEEFFDVPNPPSITKERFDRG